MFTMTVRQIHVNILLLLLAWCLINNNHLLSNLRLKTDNDSERATIADEQDYYELDSLPEEVQHILKIPLEAQFSRAAPVLQTNFGNFKD